MDVEFMEGLYKDVLFIIYYLEEENAYIDECGFTLTNIYTEVDPNVIYLFKKRREDMFVYGRNGDLISLRYERQYEYIRSENGNIIDRREIGI